MSKKLLTLRPPPQVLQRGDPDYWLDAPATPWQRNAWRPPSGAPPTIEPLEYTTSQPIRVPTVGSDVAVPFLQSLATGAFVGLVSGTLAIWQSWAWPVPVVLAALAAATMWFVSLSDTRGLLRKVETFVNRDIDQDGIVGEPERVIHEYHVKDDGQTGAHWQMMISLDIDPDRLRQFAKGLVVEERSTSTNGWVGEKGLFERTEFERLRDELISRGFAKWSKSKNRGWHLTAKGEAWFTALAAE